jgi:colanic acid biosynthesis glycosyl transferase WcaI
MTELAVRGAAKATLWPRHAQGRGASGITVAMRVLLLNQVFHPDVAATAQMAHDLARHLTAAGHEVQVVASRSIYGRRGGHLPRRECVDGANVYRVGVSLFGKGSMLTRLFDFAMFYLLATVRVFTIPRPDVVIAFTTPPLIALTGWLLRAVRGTRYVYWLMDVYPDVLAASGATRERSVLHRLLEAVSRWCLRRADRVVVLGRDMRELVLSKGVPADRVTHISVWADESQIAPMPAGASEYRAAWAGPATCVVMYSGNFGLAHDVDTIAGVIERLAGREDVLFVFVGSGKQMEALRSRATGAGWRHVRFEPYQPREKLGDLLAAADVHLISQARAMRGLIVPSKLYGIMAAGRPAVFVGPDDAEVARVLTEHDAGRVVGVGEVDSLVQTLMTLADDAPLREAIGSRARHAFEQHYSRGILCQQWLTLLQRLHDDAAPST